jgi:DNA-binding PadR family transcriptional regulator
MRVKEPIITNKRYFKIFLLIANGVNYNKVLAEKLGIKPNTLIESLQFLEKKGYLKSKQEKQFNRKIYEINFKKLADELVLDLRKNLLKEYRGFILSYIDDSEVKEQRELIWKNTNKLRKNKVLPIFIQVMLYVKLLNNTFKTYGEDLIIIREMKDLRDLFIIVITFLRYDTKFIKDKNENKDLKEISEIINLLFSRYKKNEPTSESIEKFFKRYYEEIDKAISKKLD